MTDACVVWGFCLPGAKADRIWARKRIDAKTFAFLVILAEGFEHPEYEVRWMRGLSRLFIKHFGTSVVDLA